VRYHIILVFHLLLVHTPACLALADFLVGLGRTLLNSSPILLRDFCFHYID
jgi:hypothetical protein